MPCATSNITSSIKAPFTRIRLATRRTSFFKLFERTPIKNPYFSKVLFIAFSSSFARSALYLTSLSARILALILVRVLFEAIAIFGKCVFSVTVLS